MASIIKSGDVPVSVRMQRETSQAIDTLVTGCLELYKSGKYKGKTKEEIIAELNKNAELASEA